MDDERVTSSSSNGGGGDNDRQSPLLRYSDKFEEVCGYYMSIGMSYHDYWDGDNTMVKYYHNAHEHKERRKNYELWLQGAYVYEAILCASPLLNAFSKKNEPIPYCSEPIPLTEKDVLDKEEREQKKIMEKGKAFMQAMMKSINKKFEEKTEEGG